MEQPLPSLQSVTWGRMACIERKDVLEWTDHWEGGLRAHIAAIHT